MNPCACTCATDMDLAGALERGTIRPDAHENCAWYTACEKNWVHSVRALLVSGAAPDSDAIAEGCRHDSVDAVALLLPWANKYCFKRACSFRAINTVRLLLTDPRIRPSYAPMQNVARNHDTGMLHMLLAYPSVKLAGTIVAAARIGNANAVRMLLADGRVHPGACGNKAIRQACKHGHVAVVRLLLSDPRVDASDYDNQALRRAMKRDMVDIVRLLLTDGRTTAYGHDFALNDFRYGDYALRVLGRGYKSVFLAGSACE